MVNRIETDLYQNDPQIVVTAKGNTPPRNAKIKQEVLKNVWKITKTKKVQEKILRNALTGWGIGETVYSADHFSSNMLITLKEKQNVLIELENQYMQSGIIPPPEFDSEVVKFEKELKDLKNDFTKKVLWTDTTLVSGQPSLKLVDHYKFVPDMMSKQWYEMRFAGTYCWMPIEYAVKIYPKLKKCDLQTPEAKYDFGMTDFSEDDWDAITSQFQNDKTVYKNMVKIYKIRYYKHDELKNRRVAEIIYAPHVLPNEPLVNRYLDIPFMSLPYKSLEFTSCNDKLVPVPTLAPIETYSNILQVFLTKIVKSSNSLYKKILVDAAFLEDKDFETKYNRPRNEIIPIQTGEKNIREMIYEPNQQTNILQILTASYEFTREKAEEISTLTRNRAGQPLGSGGTATEAMIINEAVNASVSVASERASEFSNEIVYNYNTIIDCKYDRQDFVEITSDNNIIEPVKYNVEELYGRFTIDIMTGSEARGFRQAQYQKARIVYETVAGSGLATGERAINNLKEFLRSMDIKENIIDKIIDPPNPIRSAWDEFGMLLKGSQFQVQPQEEDDENLRNQHLLGHQEQMILIENMEMDDNFKQQFLQFLQMHLIQTAELGEMSKIKNSNRYIPNQQNMRLDMTYPGQMNNAVTNQAQQKPQTSQGMVAEYKQGGQNRGNVGL